MTPPSLQLVTLVRLPSTSALDVRYVPFAFGFIILAATLAMAADCIRPYARVVSEVIGEARLAEYEETAMSRNSLFAIAFLLAMAGAASASQFNMQVSMSKADFDVTRANLVAQLDSDRYSEINATEKTSVIDALDRIGARLAKSPDQLNDQDRIDIYNDQELINEITTHAATNSRLYCEREAPTGSHLVRVICLTMATWMERERSGQTSMRDNAHKANASFSGATTMNPEGNGRR